MHGGSLAEAAVPEFTGAAAARHTLDRLLTVPPPWCSQTYDVTVHNRHVTPADVLRLAGPVTTISDNRLGRLSAFSKRGNDATSLEASRD